MKLRTEVIAILCIGLACSVSIIKDIYNQQSPGLFGTTAVLSPPTSNFVRDAGYDTVEKFTEFVTGKGAAPAAPTRGSTKGPGGCGEGGGAGMRRGNFTQ